MPVRFVCSNCRQALSVGRRKIGSYVDCPRCGTSNLVPPLLDDSNPPPSLPPPVDGAPTTVTSIGALAGGFEEVNELLARGPSQPARAPVPPSVSPTPWSQPVQPSEPARRASMPVVNISTAPTAREALGQRGKGPWLAVAFCLVAAVAFALGFFMGRRQSPAPVSTISVKKTEPVAIRGSVGFDAGSQALVSDVGAVVLALPVSPGAGKLRIQGLRPSDAQSEFGLARVRLDELGGDAARVGDDGSFELVVPGAGEYCILAISKQATRGGAQLRTRDLEQMRSMLESPTDLIGLQRYTWRRERIATRPVTLDIRLSATN